jgi:hypothetical protein
MITVSGPFDITLDDEHIMPDGSEIPPRLWEISEESRASNIGALSILADKRYLYTQNAKLIYESFYDSMNFRPFITRNKYIRSTLEICGEHFHAYNNLNTNGSPCNRYANSSHNGVNLTVDNIDNYFNGTKLLLLTKLVGFYSTGSWERSKLDGDGSLLDNLRDLKYPYFTSQGYHPYNIYRNTSGEGRDIVAPVMIQGYSKINDVNASFLPDDFITIHGYNETTREYVYSYRISFITTIDTYLDVDLIYFHRMFESFSFSNRVNHIEREKLKYIPETYTSRKIEASFGTNRIVNNMRVAGVRETPYKIRFYDTLDLNSELRPFYVKSAVGKCDFQTENIVIYDFDVMCNIAAILVFERGGCGYWSRYSGVDAAVIIYDVFSAQILHVTDSFTYADHCSPHIFIASNKVFVRHSSNKGVYDIYNLTNMEYIERRTVMESYRGGFEYHTMYGYITYQDGSRHIRIIDINDNYNEKAKIIPQNIYNHYYHQNKYVYIYNDKIYYAHDGYLFVYELSNTSSFTRYDLKLSNIGENIPLSRWKPVNSVSGYNDIIVVSVTFRTHNNRTWINALMFIKAPSMGNGINEFVTYRQGVLGSENIKRFKINTHGIGLADNCVPIRRNKSMSIDTINFNTIDQAKRVVNEDGDTIMAVSMDSMHTGGGLRYTRPEGLNPGDDIEINCPGEYIPPGPGPGPGPGPDPTPIPTIPPCLSAYAENKKAIVDRET